MTYMLRHVVIQYQDYRGYSMTYRVCHNVVFNKNPLNRIFFFLFLHRLVSFIFYYKGKKTFHYLAEFVQKEVSNVLRSEIALQNSKQILARTFAQSFAHTLRVKG